MLSQRPRLWQAPPAAAGGSGGCRRARSRCCVKCWRRSCRRRSRRRTGAWWWRRCRRRSASRARQVGERASHAGRLRTHACCCCFLGCGTPGHLEAWRRDRAPTNGTLGHQRASLRRPLPLLNTPRPAPPAATGARRRLISELSSCPTLFCDWFWSAAFAFAVSAAYLGGENRADVSDVVAATLAEFAHLITGVGVTGEWRGARGGACMVCRALAAVKQRSTRRASTSDRWRRPRKGSCDARSHRCPQATPRGSCCCSWRPRARASRRPRLRPR